MSFDQDPSDFAPSVQLKEQKRIGNPRTVYLPHIGAKQKAKELRRMEKAKMKPVEGD